VPRQESLTETELVQKARRGDEDAWAQLISMHQDAVFRLAYLQLGDPAEAEDAAQDCFIRAYRSLARFDVNKPLRPWLLRIVTNLASNRRRSIGRYWAALNRAAREEPLFEESPEITQSEKADSRRLWAMVKMLPVKMQSIVYLRYFLDLPVEETAGVLNLPPGTVKSQTFRALEKLRQIIVEKAPHLSGVSHE
jgi:RNA polymerase sigma factor (sigma-70 family)